MKYLILGLGNVGDKYLNTRHNIGFMVLDHYAKKNDISFSKERFGELAKHKIGSKQIYLLKPDTYVNQSGMSLLYWLKTLKIDIANILVIVDDISLPLCKVRLRSMGSSAGHNGLSDIEKALKTDVYNRLRVGIGNNFQQGEQASFVLGKFSLEELDSLKKTIEISISCIDLLPFYDITKLMTLINSTKL